MDGKSVWRIMAAFGLSACLPLGALQAQSVVTPPDQPGGFEDYAAPQTLADLSVPQLTMEQRLQMLEGEVAGLREAAAAPATPATPAAKYPVVKLTGFFQADAGWFNQDGASYDVFGDIQDVRGFRRAPDVSGKALGDKSRQESAVIDMRMGEQHRVDLARVEVETLEIELLERARTLEHAAIDQDAAVALAQFHAGSGHCARRAVKAQLQCHGSPVRQLPP